MENDCPFCDSDPCACVPFTPTQTTAERIDPYWHTCPICGFYAYKPNGRYNHMMKHVRRGEARDELNPLDRPGFHFPYQFYRIVREPA